MINYRQEILENFDGLLVKFYRIVGKYAEQAEKDEKTKGLITVGWTSVQACAKQIKQAEKSGKSLTEIKLIIFRFEQQLDALDPLDSFVPSEQL